MFGEALLMSPRLAVSLVVSHSPTKLHFAEQLVIQPSYSDRLTPASVAGMVGGRPRIA
jgi:hypothetical protein